MDFTFFVALSDLVLLGLNNSASAFKVGGTIGMCKQLPELKS